MPGKKSDGSALAMPIGEVVRAWREHRGWTITELATRAGPPITKGYISQLERNVIHQPRSRGTLDLLARTLGVEEWDLHTRRMPSDLELVESEKAAPLSTGTRAAPLTLGTVSKSDQHLGSQSGTILTFGNRVDEIVDAFQFSPENRELVERVVLETTRAIARELHESDKYRSGGGSGRR